MRGGDAFGIVTRAGLVTVAVASLLATAPCAFAVDNPDAPDHVTEFRARAAPFEEKAQRGARNEREIVQVYAEYERFLDAELNGAYSALVRRLPAEAKKRLVHSQRRWLQFRDAEFSFIAENWRPEQFGSSYAVSRGAYRTSIVRDRTITLLHYLKNYGPPTR